MAIVVILGLAGQSAWGATTTSTPSTPQQQSGTSAGLPHNAASAIAGAGGGSAPVSVPGAAPQAGTHVAAVTPTLSNVPQTVAAAETAAVDQDASTAASGAEVVADRTANRSVFANANGTMTSRVYPRPVHYQDSTGAWQNINTDLTQVGGRWQETADSSTVTFAATGNDPSVVSTPLADGESVGFGIQGAADVTGAVSGAQITYAGIEPDADATYLATANGGVKETLVLHNASAPTTWVFPLNLVGVSAQTQSDGTVTFTDAAGDVVDTIAGGFMEDSNINPASNDGVVDNGGVTYSLITTSGGPALQVSLDATWLDDPARVFPVDVDPSVLDVTTSGSTYVQSPYTNDYSSDSILKVGTYNGGGSVANSYLKFNVGGALPNDFIEAADLNLDEIWSYSCTPSSVWVSPILGGWSVTGNKTYPWVSYGSSIGTGSFAAGHDSGCPGPAWQSIDLGDNPSAAGIQLLESWSHGGANNGLAVTASSSDSNGWKQFDSLNSQFPPFLSITYSPYGAAYSFAGSYTAPTASTAGSQRVTVTNEGNSTWTVAGESLSYKLFNTAGALVATGPSTALTGSVAPGASTTLTGTIGAVSPGQYTLCWDMHVGSTSFYDGYGVPTATCETIDSVNTPPQLDSASPPSNEVVSTLRPQLFATGHDPDNYPGKGIEFQFQVYTVPTSGTPALVVDSGLQSSGGYVVPAGKLAWNQTYYWTVRDYDTIGYSPWSNPAYLSTAVPQPLITSHIGAASTTADFDPGVGDYTTSSVSLLSGRFRKSFGGDTSGQAGSPR